MIQIAITPPKLTSAKKKIDDIALLRFNRELQIQTFPWRGRRDKPGRLSQSLPFSRHIKVVKILMTASLCDFVELFVALYKLIFFVVAWLRLKSSAFSLFFTTTLFLLAMTISWFCTKFFSSENPNFPYDEYSRFDVDNVSEAECKAEFRFDKKDLPVLAEVVPSGILNLRELLHYRRSQHLAT